MFLLLLFLLLLFFIDFFVIIIVFVVVVVVSVAVVGSVTVVMVVVLSLTICLADGMQRSEYAENTKNVDDRVMKLQKVSSSAMVRCP